MGRVLRALIARWVCPTCTHHNPKGRMECRKCRRPRPLGA